MLLDDVYAEYRHTRNTELTRGEFEELMCLIPVMLVAVSDQNVDTIEMGYLTGLVHELTLEFHTAGSEEDIHRLKNLFLGELQYLLRNMRYWEDKLLGATHQLLERDEALKRRVRVRMRAVAESSAGINSYEQQKINDLLTRLQMA